MNHRARHFEGYALTLAGTALFSTKAIFIKLAYAEKADAVAMLAARMAVSLPFFAAIGVYAWLRRAGPARPSALWAAAATGFLGYYVSMWLDFAGLLYISAQLERLLLFTYPLFIMLLGAAFFGGRVTRHGVAGAGITYAGLALAFGLDFKADGMNTAIGAGLVLGCSITFALYQLFAKRYIAELGSLLFTSVALSAACLAAFGHFAIATGGVTLAASPRYWMLAAGTGLLATVLPNFLTNAGLARISATANAMIATVSPLITIYLAVLFLDEPFGWAEAAGTALVVAGVGYFSFVEARAVR